MNVIQTLEEFLDDNFILGASNTHLQEAIVKFTKLHVEAALEAASKSRCIKMYDNVWFAQSIEAGTRFHERVNITISKQAIRDSYPLTNII